MSSNVTFVPVYIAEKFLILR